jgi:NitT/TauT family transport system substrate-binding protein
MQLERWQTLVQQIVEIGDIEPESVKPEECFTLKFLPTTTAKEAAAAK